MRVEVTGVLEKTT